MWPVDGPAALVTGVGAVSPAGLGAGALWGAVRSGRVLTGPVMRFDASGYPTHQASELTTAALHELDARVPAHPSLAGRYLATAALEALGDAGLTESPARGRTGLFVGTVMGTRPLLDRGIKAGQLVVDGAGWASPDCLLDVLRSVVPIDGPAVVVAPGCSAGNHAIALGAAAVRAGEVDIAICGGTDELSREVYEIFTSLRALAPDVVRPFDAGRTGMMPGEGAGILILESSASVRARGGRPLATLRSYGHATDTDHLTRPDPAGTALRASIADCLRGSGRTGGDVDWICAHGTGTRSSDGTEARAIAAALGGTRRPAVSSVKGLLGHAQGAAAALEAVIAVQAIDEQFMPGNPTLLDPDPDCIGIDLVPPEGRPGPVRSVVSPAFGFGGAICTVLIEAADGGSHG
jgi:3-oxoacyl-(acyl-carrier-protein) synthase